MIISLKLIDKIRCTDCNRVCKISELDDVNGHTIPKYDGKGGEWQQILYYCPCNNEGVKVYDPGDGKLVLAILAHVELVES